ncbi:hypothetical protein [Caldithrix abyssi]
MLSYKDILKIFWLLPLFFMACSSEPQIELIDRLIRQGDYQKAREVIAEEMQKTWADTLQYHRLRYRLIKIQKNELFAPIDSVINTDINKALGLLKNLEDSLKGMEQANAKFFYFDLYYRKANAYEALNADSLWYRETLKALHQFTDQYELKRDLYERAAFYLAERGKYDQGLKMLDRSFREIRLSRLPEPLKEAYYAYLNGDFERALRLLESVHESQKDRHWNNMQAYLKNYGNKLSIEERFKLW